MAFVEGKLKTPIVISAIVVGLLLIAGAVFITTAFINANNTKQNQSQNTSNTKPVSVSPDAIQESLKDSNAVANQQVEAHKKSRAAIDEQQTKLVK